MVIAHRLQARGESPRRQFYNRSQNPNSRLSAISVALELVHCALHFVFIIITKFITAYSSVSLSEAH